MTETRLIRLAEVRQAAKNGVARRVRLDHEISVAEMSSVVGVAPSTISRWETGERTPRGDAALRWADALDALDRIAS